MGSVERAMTLDHICRNRLCVNPAHLEIVSVKENVLRGVGISAENSRKTHCIDGHEFNEENTLVLKDGSRVCRACARERARRRHGTKPEAYRV